MINVRHPVLSRGETNATTHEEYLKVFVRWLFEPAPFSRQILNTHNTERAVAPRVRLFFTDSYVSPARPSPGRRGSRGGSAGRRWPHGARDPGVRTKRDGVDGWSSPRKNGCAVGFRISRVLTRLLENIFDGKRPRYFRMHGSDT